MIETAINDGEIIRTHLLRPTWHFVSDEFIISYKDRSAVLPFENHKKAVSNNGILGPIIVINGKVTGTWKRTIKKDKVIVETEFFKQPGKSTKSLIEKAFTQFGHFLERNIEIVHGLR